MRCKDLETSKMWHLKTQTITIHIGAWETIARNIKNYISRFRELSLAQRQKMYCTQLRPTSLGKFYQCDKGLFNGRRILEFMYKLSYIHRVLHILQWFLFHIFWRFFFRFIEFYTPDIIFAFQTFNLIYTLWLYIDFMRM